LPSPETYQLLLAAAQACEDKKAEDIRILALDPSESGLTDYFLICNGTNDRQNIANADEIEIRLKREFGVYPNSVEGRRQAEWILLDYVDFIVHVFSAEKRAFYGLERLRKSATSISVADLSAELKSAIAATRAKTPKKKAPTKKPASKSPPTKSPPTKSRPTKPAARSAATKKSAPPRSAKNSPAKKATSRVTKKPVTK